MNIRLFRVVKVLIGLGRLIRDPDRLDQVFEVADLIVDPAGRDRIIDGLSLEPVCAKAFVERRRVNVDLAVLRQLPAGTLGRIFAEHMIGAGLDPAALPNLPSPDARGFLRAHLYETHDIWHAVTGFGTDPLGELGLQAFYLAQIKARLPSLLLAAGFARVALLQRELAAPLMDAVERGWRVGKAAKPLFGTRWDELWATPIADVRARFGIAEDDVGALTFSAAPSSSTSSFS